MNPRPILRTKTFWLGIFILTFIGWLWTRAHGTLDRVDLQTLRGRMLITNSVNGLSIIRDHDPLGKWSDFKYTHSPLPLSATAPRTLFPDPGTLDLFETQGIGSGAVRIAHWLMVLLLLIPWTTFFIWRHRRIRATATHQSHTHTTPP